MKVYVADEDRSSLVLTANKDEGYDINEYYDFPQFNSKEDMEKALNRDDDFIIVCNEDIKQAIITTHLYWDEEKDDTSYVVDDGVEMNGVQYEFLSTTGNTFFSEE